MPIVRPDQNTGSGGGGSGVIVTDGVTTVNPTTTVDFTAGATVTNAGGGQANIAISATAGVNSVTAADTSIVVAGTATNPTVATGTLDVIATDHPPALGWSNNSKKITSLANGSAAQDAAAFGQIPTALPPNGSAGGDLTGTYPNPTVAANAITIAKLATGVTLNAIAAANATAANVAMGANKITGLANGTVATDAAAFGQIPAALPPNGSAGGDLTGTYPNPTIGNVSLLTTKGDILQDTANGVAGRLAIGATGNVLTVASGLASWAAPAVASVFGRTGAVVATTADYTAAQVTNAMSTVTYDGAAIAQQVLGTTATQTVTNKRITKRTGTVASSATPTINTDTVDFFSITALAVAMTSLTTNLSGTPTEAQTLWLAITDNGTARALTFGASFEASTVALPTTTVISTRLDVGFVWNTVTTKWRCVAVA